MTTKTTFPIQSTKKRIKALRLILRTTQDQFAEAMDVTRLTISNWETGAKLPSINHQSDLDSVAAKQNIDNDDLNAFLRRLR